MANTLRLRVTGDWQALRAAVKQYGLQMTRAAVADMQQTVTRTVQRTADAAPVDTGALKASIKGHVSTDGYTVRGRVRVGVAYAAYVEFGTERVDKHPHLVPAAIDERKQLQSRLRSRLTGAAPRALGVPSIVGNEDPLPDVGIE